MDQETDITPSNATNEDSLSWMVSQAQKTLLAVRKTQASKLEDEHPERIPRPGPPPEIQPQEDSSLATMLTAAETAHAPIPQAAEEVTLPPDEVEMEELANAPLVVAAAPPESIDEPAEAPEETKPEPVAKPEIEPEKAEPIPPVAAQPTQPAAAVTSTYAPPPPSTSSFPWGKVGAGLAALLFVVIWFSGGEEEAVVQSATVSQPVVTAPVFQPAPAVVAVPKPIVRAKPAPPAPKVVVVAPPPVVQQPQSGWPPPRTSTRPPVRNQWEAIARQPQDNTPKFKEPKKPAQPVAPPQYQYGYPGYYQQRSWPPQPQY